MTAAGLPEPEFQFGDFFTIVLKRINVPEKAIALSLGVSRKRLEKMMYLIENLQPGKMLDIEKAAEKFNVISKSIKRDLLLLEKKGWVIGSGTTSNRTYKLSEQAIEQFGSFESK